MLLGEVADLPVGHDEGVAGLVVDDRLVADRRDRQGAGGLESLECRALRAPRLAFLHDRDQRRRTGRVGEHRARRRHRDDAVAQVLGDRVLVGKRHGGGLSRVTDPQETGGRIEDREDGAALHLGGALGQGDGLADREGGGFHGRHRARDRLPQRHVAAGLTDVEGRGLDGNGAVEHERVVVEVAQELTILVRHPNATVIDADLGDLDAAVDHGEDAEHRGHQQDGDCGHPLRPAVSRLTRLVHVASSVFMCALLWGGICIRVAMVSHSKDTHRPTLWINARDNNRY